jgi:hypothetical protein
VQAIQMVLVLEPLPLLHLHRHRLLGLEAAVRM